MWSLSRVKKYGKGKLALYDSIHWVSQRHRLSLSVAAPGIFDPEECQLAEPPPIYPVMSKGRYKGEPMKSYAIALLQDCSEERNGFLVAFDYIMKMDVEMKDGKPVLKKKCGPKKGVMMVYQGMESFFWKILMSVPPRMRCFYQVISPEKSCALYIDIDVDNTTYNVEALWAAIITELALATGKEEQTLWSDGFLTDSSETVDGRKTCTSSHGVFPALVFAHNKQIRSFMVNIAANIAKKHPALLIRKGEEGDLMIPIDTKVYSKWRYWRTLYCTKMRLLEKDTRFLKEAKYNRSAVEQSAFERFRRSLVPQGLPVTVLVQVDDAAEKQGQRKRAKTKSTVSVPEELTPLVDAILARVKKWGNTQAYVSTKEATLLEDGSARLYIAFGQARMSRSHSHKGQNVYATAVTGGDASIVVRFRCHGNDCKGDDYMVIG